MQKYILNDKNKNDIMLDKIGGKAISLYKLCDMNIPIPRFFVITMDAYKEFVRENAIENAIKDLVEMKKYDEVRHMINECKIPEVIWKEIVESFKRYNMDLVSVRSSALMEDGETKSFAGQFDTYLATPFEDLERNIKRCWASYYNDNIMTYVEDELPDGGMSVIIQAMIDADVSGIGFSKAPNSEYEDCILIEAAFGVGENIVSGIITPNQYYFFEQNGEILNFSKKEVLSEKEVEILSSYICKIRDFYEAEVDTEWCIKDGQVYFLQARPITAGGKKTKPYKMTLRRPLPLVRVELYARGEYEGILWLTDNQFYFNPLFICRDGEVSIYYNNISQKENPLNMFHYLCSHKEEFYLKINIAQEACERLERMILGKKVFSKQQFVQDIITIYPFSSLGNLAGSLYKFLAGDIYDFFETFRIKYGEILTRAEEYLLKKVEEQVGRGNSYLYLLEEVLSKEMPELKEICVRENGYLYFNNELIVEKGMNDINHYLNENNIALLKDIDVNVSSELNGTVAFGGLIRGKVTKIAGENDFGKMGQGDVLVASMTVPKYLPVMKKAAAIITDEGGALCHAAIVARELKIPTIIGTKNATKLLNDGDIVEVDANNGRVSVL